MLALSKRASLSHEEEGRGGGGGGGNGLGNFFARRSRLQNVSIEQQRQILREIQSSGGACGPAVESTDTETTETETDRGTDLTNHTTDPNAG